MTESEIKFAKAQLAKYKKKYEENEREYQMSGIPSLYKAYQTAEKWIAIINEALDAKNAVDEDRARRFRNMELFYSNLKSDGKTLYTKDEVLKLLDGIQGL